MTMHTTERLVLRRWKDTDLEPFAALNLDPEVMEFFPETYGIGRTRILVERIESHFEQHGFGLWALERKIDGAFVGFTGLITVGKDLPFAPAIEVGWRLAKQYWGQGYATEAAKAALRFGFEQLGLTEIVSFTSHLNLRSVAVMKRLGMQRDLDGDFDHPNVAVGDPLRSHILYRVHSE